MKSFVVIGAGRFGGAVARELSGLGYEVMVIDKDEVKTQIMAKYVTHAVTADATDDAVLHNLGVRNFDAAVISIGEDLGASVLTTMLLSNLGTKYIIAKAINRNQARILEKVGANRIVFPEKDMGIRVAQSLVRTNLLDYIELSPDYSIMEIEVPKKWVGKSIRELNIRAKLGVNIVAVKRGLNIRVSPEPDYVFEDTDYPIVIGCNDDMNKL